MSEPLHPPSESVDRRKLLRQASLAGAAATATWVAGKASAKRRTPALRSSRRRRPSYQKAAPPQLGIIALNRLAFGPRPGDLSAFNALGPTPEARLEAWVEQQLNPRSIPDPGFDNRLNLAGFTTLNKTRRQLWEQHRVNPSGHSTRVQPREETERATYLRAIYSERQLVEVLADFWHNHFNVDANMSEVASTFVHYDRDVIRANVLGNFRDMLEEVTRSVAMLVYLDNFTNANAGPNENYCRELFELHTMGSKNYLGIIPQHQVPIDPVSGRPIGYVDADVFEATRCFTGWTFRNSSYNSEIGNTGEFLYRAEWHDRFQKVVLGSFLPQDQAPLRDGTDVLDILASHPATARHIVTKLCQRLIADDPPNSIINHATEIFINRADTPDQLKRVVRAIVLSQEFRDTWSAKTKRPFEIVVGALRATRTHFSWARDDSPTNSLLHRIRDMGQQLFRHPTPNGYPDSNEAWENTSVRAMAWRLVNWLMDLRVNSEYVARIPEQTPPNVRSARDLVDFWTHRILSRPLATEDNQVLIDFMAQGFNPDMDLPWDTDEDTEERLRSLVGLILMTPDFLAR